MCTDSLPTMLNMDPLEHQVWRLLTVVVFISVINVPLVSAYCWQAGQNPYLYVYDGDRMIECDEHTFQNILLFVICAVFKYVM